MALVEDPDPEVDQVEPSDIRIELLDALTYGLRLNGVAALPS